ncbi:NYN domain-containing protein [Calderihabitans maritimus]|uniref:Predicted RNA-binding protein containing a PIN domain n=1 Tax=Calderihabitans maritimus TaxID=1246530 RepID=A0A1Z5HPB6_9FIRM|nr:NYN domain-containing protein [Calderihabitans maritimus]GAW91130.1 predicted RNA-binding protein containing a PIN domain [Calderihabitans maritimus]
MEEYLVIDGYNVINGWPELNHLKEKSFEHARDKLIEMFSNYQAFLGIKVIIVFDAHHVKGSTQKKEIISGVEVIYSGEGETADMVIEKLVDRLPDGVLVSVATSDWAEQRMIMGKGALRLSVRELYRKVQQAEESSRRYFSSKPCNPFPLDSQLDEYLKVRLEKWRRDK